jgi:hypothetical protein
MHCATTYFENTAMAKTGVPLFSAPSFTQGEWAAGLRKAILARQRFIPDWGPRYRIWRYSGHQWLQYEPDAFPKAPFFWSGKPAIRATRPKSSRHGQVNVDEALFVGYYVERGIPHCPEMPAKEMQSGWHWYGFERCFTVPLLRDDLNALMLNLPAGRRSVWIDCSETEGPGAALAPPLVQVLPYEGLTTLAEVKAIADGVPDFQWVNVFLGVRYTMGECLAEQGNLVDHFRNPIVRANEIRQLVEDARP